MKSADIRDAFLTYFESKQHTRVDSSSLVPGNDPTLLFTNAGMVQFKDVFLGEDKRPYVRATSSQRCVRAGGKHNDLENVGYTARHHTFFEMLGNFSFGDYFKREAIQFGWEFLTKVLKLPKERLWVTVHVTDDEAAKIWIDEMGIDPNRISRLEEDNFWQMGDTGPCGPCSEIFYDHGEDVPGGPPGSPDDDLDRYIEIWNLVFMQYQRQTDGALVPLPKPSVDTGMGLERIAAVMQNVHSNYDIDLFQALLKASAKAIGTQDFENKSLRVVADHIRSCAFLIADGVMPSNEGRGYVLRRIIRRAVRHGNKLGQEKPFFYTLVKALAQQMGEAYPELFSKQKQIEKVLLAEEEQFAKTLDKGLNILEERLKNITGTQISGDIVFTLYDTYGFPVDLTNDIAREKNLTLDMEGYTVLMEQQKKKSQDAGKFGVDYTSTLSFDSITEFVGYSQLETEANIVSIVEGDQYVKQVSASPKELKKPVLLVLDKTPFYAESGGQVGDKGMITLSGDSSDSSGDALFHVTDTQKQGETFLHRGFVEKGSFTVDSKIIATVTSQERVATALNHSATHLLHAALRKVLGDQVTQKGSLVDSQRLRFDFSHLEAVKPQELKLVERKVNHEILRNSLVETEICDMDTAKQKGAMALFGEKYGDDVRVLSMGGDFSVELCGGTHVMRTGDIGLMRITSESGIASGVRRIEAITGEKALAKFDQQDTMIEHAAALLKTHEEKLLEKVEQLVQLNKQLEKDLSAVNSQLASASVSDWIDEAKEVNGIKVLTKIVDGADPKSLRDLVDQLKNKLGSGAVLLATTNNGKVSIAAGVTQDNVGKIKAGDMVKTVAEKIGGKGGGRPDMAQGGGTDASALPGAIDFLMGWVQEVL